MPVLSLACHLPHNTPNIPSRYNNEQTTKQTKAINNSYIYIYISCKCDTNRAGHFTFDAYASRPVACCGLLMPYGITFKSAVNQLIHWGLVTHICVSNLTIISSDNSLSPALCQAIIWTNAGILLIFIREKAFESVVYKMAAILSWPQCVNGLLTL